MYDHMQLLNIERGNPYHMDRYYSQQYTKQYFELGEFYSMRSI